MGMIIWPGDLDFWEQRQEYERRRADEARRRARLDAEWWRSLQQAGTAGRAMGVFASWCTNASQGARDNL